MLCIHADAYLFCDEWFVFSKQKIKIQFKICFENIEKKKGGSFLALGPPRLQPTFSLSLFLAVGPLPSFFSRAGRLLPILSHGPACQSRPPSLPILLLGRLSSFSCVARVAKQDQLGLSSSLSKGPS